MARRGEDIFRVSVRGAGRTAASLGRSGRELQDIIVRELRELGDDVEFTFQQFVPEDTSELLEKVKAVPSFRVSRPRVRVAVEPLQGHEGEQRTSFDYLEVTRFGHRKRLILPKRARALKVHYAGHRNPAVYEFASFVPGALPDIDWVREAQPLIDRDLDRAEIRIGRRIERSIRG